MSDIPQQIHSHTNAINDLANAFGNEINRLHQIIKQLEDQLAHSQNEKSQIEYQQNERVRQLEEQIASLSVKDTVHNNASIHQQENIVSGNGKFVITLQNDGNLVGYNGHNYESYNAFWSSKTNGKGCGPFRLTMQNDGNLVIYDGGNNATWSSNSCGQGQGPFKLTIQNDRNLVIYDRNGQATWSSGTNI